MKQTVSSNPLTRNTTVINNTELSVAAIFPDSPAQCATL